MSITLSSPADNAGHTLDPRPAQVWRAPNKASAGNLHFKVFLDDSASSTEVAYTSSSGTGFEYYDGTSNADGTPHWMTWSGAVASGDDGSKVRWRPAADLNPAAPHTWYWCVQAVPESGGAGTVTNVRRFATAVAPWSSDLAAGTSIRAMHMTDLRIEANAARVFHGLAAITWADAITARVTLVRKAHLEELRTALQPVYAEGGYVQHATRPASISPASEAGFYGETLTPMQTLVRVAHFQRIRDALGGF